MTDIAMVRMLEERDAEIGRLQDKIRRLLDLSQNNAHSWDTIVRERDELRAEIERLRAALQEIVTTRYDPTDRAAAIARRALEPKVVKE